METFSYVGRRFVKKIFPCIVIIYSYTVKLEKKAAALGNILGAEELASPEKKYPDLFGNQGDQSEHPSFER